MAAGQNRSWQGPDRMVKEYLDIQEQIHFSLLSIQSFRALPTFCIMLSPFFTS